MNARTRTQLVHPHVVKLFEVIDDASKDALYLVIEYVPGGAVMEFSAEERRCVWYGLLNRDRKEWGGGVAIGFHLRQRGEGVFTYLLTSTTMPTSPHHSYVYPRSRDGTMGEAKAAQVLCDVLAGLVYLHMHHICHRDLKPEVDGRFVLEKTMMMVTVVMARRLTPPARSD